MATDAGQYTHLSDSIAPVSLNMLMDRFYNTMVPAIKNHNGLISDVIGDTMMALWVKPNADKHLRIDACLAALKINDSLQQVNHHPHQLPTRIGLHYGAISLSNVDTKEHYEYRAVGDIADTASAIGALNKLMRTSVLTSISVIDGLDEFVTRDLGLFMLPGKSQPVHIFELAGKQGQTNPKLFPLFYAFSKALILFQKYDWGKALKAFYNINKYYPNDGPTLFYLHYLQHHSNLLDVQVRYLVKPVIDIGNLTETNSFLILTPR